METVDCSGGHGVQPCATEAVSGGFIFVSFGESPRQVWSLLILNRRSGVVAAIMLESQGWTPIRVGGHVASTFKC